MNKLLIVVDYQVDFVNGLLPCGEPAIALEAGLIEKIKEYRQSGNRVLFTLDTHYENYPNTREGKIYPSHCIDNTNGHSVYGEVAKYADNILLKETFGSADIATHRDVEWADEITLVGVATNVCVLNNAVILYNYCPDKQIDVIADLCASFDENLHNSAIAVMQSFGINIK